MDEIPDLHLYENAAQNRKKKKNKSSYTSVFQQK